MALLLLSRINGDAPRASIMAAAFWMVREWADFQQAGAALREHPDAKPSPRPLRRSHFTFEASPERHPSGCQRTHAHGYKTLRRQPLVPDFERRPARVVLAGRHGGVGLGRRRPRHGALARLRLR